MLIVDFNLGIKVLWIIFIFYFFIDWFINLVLSSMTGFKNGGWIWFVNAILLFWLAILFIIWWEQDLSLFIGIFVWISLFFDGISLIITGKVLNNFLKIK